MAVYLTGDPHGDFSGIVAWCKRMGLTKDDTVIFLGDHGVNWYQSWKDKKNKEKLAKCECTFFPIRGNHDWMPEDVIMTPGQVSELRNPNVYAGEYPIPTGHVEIFWDNFVLVEDKFPNIKFPYDGFIYTIEGKECMVIGGGYSVDKFYRLENGWTWVRNEQLDETAMEEIYQIYLNNKVDYILSHVAPVSYESDIRHLWMSQDGVKGGWMNIDKSMEIWMNKLLWDETNDIEKWYFGHNHANINCVDGIGVMLFECIIPFGEKAPAVFTPENDRRVE
jgi:hypothetical protein